MSSEPAVNLLEVHDLSVDYDGARALTGANLAVVAGEIVALVGSNGAGKSTLLAAITGIAPAASGGVRWRGQEIAGMPTHRIARLGVALVPEGRQLFPRMSVARNLQLGAFGKRDREQRARTEAQVVELFPILYERRRQLAGTLSGGEQQMLAIGRALMADPQLLLLDEPSLGLAPIMVERILESLRRIRDAGITVLLVEQRLEKALRLADRAYVLQTGRIVLEGPAGDLLGVDEVRRAYLGL